MSNQDLPEEIKQAALSCIHCGLCLPVCPTYRETGSEAESPRGRIYLMRAMAEGRQAPGAYESLDGCVGCRACETACPAGVEYGSLLERARAQYVEPERPQGVRTRFWRPVIRQVLPHRERMKLALLPARLARKLLVRDGRGPDWMPSALRRSLEVLPEPQAAAPVAEWTPAVGSEKGTVAFLAGCAMPAMYPGANAATVRMLARAGYRVWTPGALGCCGAIASHDGDLEGAKAQARRNLDVLASGEFVALVSNAAGCGAALKGYDHLLAGEPDYAERAAWLSARVKDFSEVLVEAELPLPSRAIEATVTYHAPCHLAHGQGVRQAPRELLKRLPGVRFVELPEADWCCGGAGSYTLLQPEMADKLLAHKLENVASTGAEIVVTANPPCLMQIGMGLRKAGREVRLLHLAELLDEAYA